MPRIGRHLRRGPQASTSRAQLSSHPIHKSLYDSLPSPLVCSHPKEQGLWSHCPIPALSLTT